MATYKNIDEFIMEVFPQEFQKISKLEKSDIEEFIEEADAEFDQKLEAIIKGEKEQKPE